MRRSWFGFNPKVLPNAVVMATSSHGSVCVTRERTKIRTTIEGAGSYRCSVASGGFGRGRNSKNVALRSCVAESLEHQLSWLLAADICLVDQP